MGTPLSMGEQFIQKITEVIENNLHDEKFGVTELANELGMSRSTLHRKVKNIIKKSISDFIRETRLKRAYELLKSQSGTASEIAYKVGFNSPAYFNKCFSDRYSFTPGDVIKGKYPKDVTTKSDISVQNKSYKKPLIYILIIAAITIAVYVGFFQNRLEVENTIAVLPPQDKSPDNNECIMLEGLYQYIQSSLFSIKDLNVKSSLITDLYRNTGRSLETLDKELNVNYIIKISGQTFNDHTTIWVELIETKSGNQRFKRSYNSSDGTDVFHEIQQEIAILVCNELHTVITDEELIKIKKLPTENKAANNLYEIALLDLQKFERTRNKEDYLYAKSNLEKAIYLDSSFADAYVALAEIYLNYLPFSFRVYVGEKAKLYNSYLDSGLIMINKAEKFGYKNTDKILLNKANYLQFKGEYIEATETFERIWRDKEKDFRYYELKMPYYLFNDDYYNVIKHCLYYLKLKPPSIDLNQNRIFNLSMKLAFTGFPELAKEYNQQWFDYLHDSVMYLDQLKRIHSISYEMNDAIRILQLLYKRDSTRKQNLLHLWFLPYLQRDFETAFRYAQLYEKIMIEHYNDTIYNAHIGSLYQQKGMNEKANMHIQKDFENCMWHINENTPYAQRKHVNIKLAGIYSLKGDKENALKQLSEMENHRNVIGINVIFQIKNFQIFENVKDEPEFKSIIQKLEQKYDREHEKVKKFLIKEGLTPQ